MLSTFHDDTFIQMRHRTWLAEEAVKEILQPQVIKDYNLNKKGVDKGQYCKKLMNIHTTYSAYNFLQLIRWYFDTVLHVVLLSGGSLCSSTSWTHALSTHALYSASSEKKLTQLEFRQAAAEGLLVDHKSTKVRHRAQDPRLSFHLKERAFAELILTTVVQTIRSAATELLVAGTRHNIAASSARHPTAFMKSIILLQTISSHKYHHFPFIIPSQSQVKNHISAHPLSHLIPEAVCVCVCMHACVCVCVCVCVYVRVCTLWEQFGRVVRVLGYQNQGWRFKSWPWPCCDLEQATLSPSFQCTWL